MTNLERLNEPIEAGKFDFEYVTEGLYNAAETVSTGVFKWIEKSSRKGFKKEPAKVRVHGSVNNLNGINAKAAEVACLLQEGKYNGAKTVKVK